MILAAGLGTRMRPLTDNTPKPMLAVAGKPLIQHHVEKLVASGINEIIINHAYLGEQIEGHLGDGSKFNAAICYSRETEPLETGGGIFKALPFFAGDSFLVVNGDIWCDIEYQSLPEQLVGLAHLVMVRNPAHNPDGDFMLDVNSDSVLENAEQVDQIEGKSYFTYSGLSLLSPRLFERCELGKFPLAPLMRSAMKQRQVSGQLFEGYWLDVGTPARLDLLEEHLQL